MKGIKLFAFFLPLFFLFNIFLTEVLAGDPLSYVKKGIEKRLLNDYVGSLEDFQKALKIEPQFYFAYEHIALTNISMGKYDDALKSINLGIRMNPNHIQVVNGGAHSVRAFIRQLLQDKNGACSDWDIALARGLDSRDDHWDWFKVACFEQ